MAVPAPPQLMPHAPVRRLAVEARSDEQLVASARAGQAAAHGLIWDRYAPLMRRILQRSLGPEGDVDDALQDTFITLFQGLDRLRDASALRSYLIGIAMRMASAQLRRRKRRSFLRRVFRDNRAAAAQKPADHDAREALRRLYGALDELGTETRLAFALRYIEGLPLPEVAEALGMSLATLKRRLAKARSQVEARAERDPVLRSYGATIASRRGER